MALYINGIGCISPQFTYDNSGFLPKVKEHFSNKMFCVEPDYSKFFDAGSLRRMGRLIKFGSAAGMLALKDADIKTPGAISTGTGFGLMETSQKFLKSIIEAEETAVSPTAFIQSTHNTVSSHIALMCGCHKHNNTFAHRGFSFESALSDAQLLSEENFDNILVGAYDEVSDYCYAVMLRMNELRVEPCNNLSLLKNKFTGTIAGEGAAFFVLSKTGSENCYGSFAGYKTFYNPRDSTEVEKGITSFLQTNSLKINDIDVVISGVCGDLAADKMAYELNEKFFTSQTIVTYKHLCGEYMTSSAFAFWLAAKMMKTQQIPSPVVFKDESRPPKNVLLYNSHQANHSLILFRYV